MKTLMKSKNLEGIIYILPYAFIWGIFLAWPLVYGFYISLFKWQPLLGSEFVGLKNYTRLFYDPRFLNSLLRTAEFAAIAIPLIIVIGLAFALILKASKGSKVFGFIESGLFFPYLLNVSIVSILWKWLLDPDFGVIIGYLKSLGVTPPFFLNDPGWAIPTIALATAWWLAGYRMVIFGAALEDIPPEIFEVAKIDGAGPFRQLFSITLPLIKPAMLFALVLTAISSFRVLGQVLMMTAGGPGRASEVLALYMYRVGWHYLEMGRAAAIGFILLVIILIFTLFSFRFLSHKSEV